MAPPAVSTAPDAGAARPPSPLATVASLGCAKCDPSGCPVGGVIHDGGTDGDGGDPPDGVCSNGVDSADASDEGAGVGRAGGAGAADGGAGAFAPLSSCTERGAPHDVQTATPGSL